MSASRKLLVYSDRPLAALLALFLLLFATNLLFPRDLWVQDEARYGEVVREMTVAGSWLVPTLDGHPYPDKPPLYFWLLASFEALVGHSELAFRLVTVLSTLAALAGVYQTANRLAGPKQAFWSSVLFGTAFLSLIVGQIIRMDMLLTAATVYAWFALQQFLTHPARRFLVAFWGFTALGLAVKGPIALLFTLLPGMIWVAAEQGWRGLKSIRPISGTLVLVGLVGAWILAVLAQGHQQYLLTIWNQQLLGRAVESWSHKEPFYFYVMLAPLLLMPWTALVVQGFDIVIRRRLPNWKGLLVYAVMPLVAISLISGKLFIYLQPLVPAYAIIGGIAAVDLVERSRVSLWHSLPPVGFVFLLTVLVGWLAAHYAPSVAVYVVAVGLLMIAVAGFQLRRSSGRRWLWGWVGISIPLSWLLFGVLPYLLNPYFSARAIGEAISRQASQAQEVGVVRDTPGILNYYARRMFTRLSIDDASSWWRAHPDAMIVIKDEDVEQAFGPPSALDACRVDESYVVLFKNYRVLSGCRP